MGSLRWLSSRLYGSRSWASRSWTSRACPAQLAPQNSSCSQENPTTPQEAAQHFQERGPGASPAFPVAQQRLSPGGRPWPQPCPQSCPQPRPQPCPQPCPQPWPERMQHRQEAEPIIGKKGLRVIAAISSPSIRQMTAASLSFSLREHFTSIVGTGSTGTMSEPLRMYAFGSASSMSRWRQRSRPPVAMSD